MPNFKEYQASLIPAAPNDPLTDYQTVLGSKKDDVISADKTAIKDRFIQTATSDALPHLGINANTPKPELMTDDQYRNKLSKTWDRWISSGTPNRMILDIQELGFVNVGIVPVWTLVGPNTYINTLTIPEINPGFVNSWGAFWIVIGKPNGFTIINWGQFNWGEAAFGDVSGDRTLLARLVSIIKQMKPAWTSCRGIIFMQGAANVWDQINWGGGNFNFDYGLYRLKEDWE